MLHNLAQNAADIVTLLTALVTIMGAVIAFLSHLHLKNKRLAQILNAALIAEKAVDKTAYNDDGSINQARMDMATSLLKIADPKIDTATAQAQIEQVLSAVHTSVKEVESAPKPPTDPPIPQKDVDPTKNKSI